MKIYGVTGESLGEIGEQAVQQDEEQPEWKRILASTPSVSIRKGIAWGSDPPSEPTSTLVLTSSKSYYVDIRFSLTGASPTSGPDYWSFAGTTKSVFPQSRQPLASPKATTFPCSIHSAWTRFVDSRGDIATPDQGTSFLLHDGSVLELGEMENPKTRVKTAYQELWATPEEKDLRELLGRDTPDPDPVLPDIFKSLPSRPVIVALFYTGNKTDSEPQGMVIHIGPFCQGIIATGTQADSSKPAKLIVLVERWCLMRTYSVPSTAGQGHSLARMKVDGSEDHQGPEDHGSWVRDPRSDYREGPGVWMPCMQLCDREEERRFEVGDSLSGPSSDHGAWRIVEAEY